ncbi:MAG: DNA-3-methyladenine glycosylase 2 family protein [Alphaproteobacteria bacterium]|nr:DNA-3-methyladenine glycosylase 2 family protein [Alphaproteobacteria bacterium]
MHPYYWNRASKELSRNDPVMARLIRQYKGEALFSRGDAFVTLVRSIVGQQISVKAADSIWMKMVQGIGPVTAHSVLSQDEALLRSYGLSGQKIAYLKHLSLEFHEGKFGAMAWEELEDEHVIRELVSLRGIGTWTAEMFLIFHLMRPDVFPVADIGLRKAVEKHYRDSETMNLAELEKISEAWRPWRTVATWYLWRSLDPVPVAY